MRSSNPVMRTDVFRTYDAVESRTMTIQGTATKTLLLVLLAAVSAGVCWYGYAQNGLPAVMNWIYGGLIVGLILGIATSFKPNWAPVTAPAYALAEGLFLGGISAFVDTQYPGIAFQAICLTFGTLFCMMLAYQSGWIRATEKFKAGMMAAMGAVFLIYIVSWIMGFFGMTIPYIHEGGLIGIGFSVVVVAIAALCLILDFDFIEQGERMGAPKSMEWYGAFSLLVTLVWLYIEILRLLAKLRDD